MKNGLILTIASWAAVLLMMAVICWQLANVFAPEYPATSVRYTATSYKSLEYENAQNRAARVKAERFIREMADGNLR